MKDMFYNYDHKVILGTDPEVGTHFTGFKPQDTPESYTCTKIIKNIKGEPIGIEAKENSVFKLYFSLDTFVDSGAIYDILNNAILEFKVFDRQHNEIDEEGSYISSINPSYEDNCVVVELISDQNGPLKYGLYTMQLDAIFTVDEIENRLTLFSERDGKLSIR